MESLAIQKIFLTSRCNNDITINKNKNKMKKEMFPFQDYKAQWVEIVKNAIEEDGEDAIEMGYDEQLQLSPLCKNLHDLYKVNEEFGWWDINNYQEMRKLVSFQ